MGLGAISQVHAQATVPDYVLKYAPLLYLHSEDAYMPSSIEAQLANSVPQVDYKAVQGAPSPLALNNLDQLNALGGSELFLTSKEGIRELPDWFKGVRPDGNGKTGDAVCSSIVVRDHGDGTVDAFYFYFQAYNQGNTVLGLEFGHHVGDWEHNMIRFVNGAPQAVWYSQHATGQAFTYKATEKQGDRPIGYVANGTHAVYATPGTHDHTIPNFNLPAGFLEDETDRGILWDPLFNAYHFSYDTATGKFTPYDSNTPVQWLYFEGRWGDKQLPDNAEGQVNIFGQRKYTSGPTGPKFKSLDREKVCPPSVDLCVIRPFLTVKRAEV
ncbi:hypothetical protein AJ80_01585 [Polytolypa hystricis UAMH7299]|uniref:Vacuolar protein sorting-associated protein 62 n=1 Tax=Polytolypa hystricis (strain UAMH7299) TaxID=1447883 RepID=A0A2B7YZQ9_POLH7|nr:hypothetical protein AJ80_01585 [Polytolypa hystricis UAMH7299]